MEKEKILVAADSSIEGKVQPLGSRRPCDGIAEASWNY